jgi:integrase
MAQALDQAVRWSWIHRNVAKLARPPKEVRSEGRSLTPEQARHLLDTLKGHRNEVLYTLMLTTGLRRGEALGLKWIDIDWARSTLRVARQLLRTSEGLVTTDTKTISSRRVVNLPAQLVGMLRTHLQSQIEERTALGAAWVDSGFVFTTAIGTPLDPRNLLRDFKQACHEAELGDWHPHELRHSAASLMLASGVKLQVVSEVLGHSSIRMTADVYGHILDPDREAAAEAMAATLWA